MDRAGKRVRDIKFHSKKNGKLVLVHSEEARAYTKYLEERPEVASYEAGRPLDAEHLNVIQKTDIRGEYFTQPWASDFYIRFTDGTVKRMIPCTLAPASERYSGYDMADAAVIRREEAERERAARQTELEARIAMRGEIERIIREAEAQSKGSKDISDIQSHRTQERKRLS